MESRSKTTRRLLLAFAFIAPFVSIALIRTHIVLALAPLFISHLLLLYATLVASSQWWGPVFTSFATEKAEVWLTIDDGPSPEHTLQMLEILERFGARATFFVIGANAEKCPHLVTEILARGHSIANHTFSHPGATFWCAGPGRVAREIDGCAELLRSTATRQNLFFRAPVGMKSPFLHPALDKRALALIGWTVRGLDTVQTDAAKISERIAKRSKPGAIVLLHENHHIQRDRAFSPLCLELTLQRLTESGYQFVIPARDQLRISGAGK